jgi:hypothetical protein
MPLRDIETNGVTWWNAAESQYRKSSYGSDNDGVKWLKNVMDVNGPISPTTIYQLHKWGTSWHSGFREMRVSSPKTRRLAKLPMQRAPHRNLEY